MHMRLCILVHHGAIEIGFIIIIIIVERYHFKWPWLTLDRDFRLNISETTQYTATVTIER